MERYCICGHSIKDHFPCELDYGGHVCLGGDYFCDCMEYEEAPVIGFTDEDAVDAPSHKRNTD